MLIIPDQVAFRVCTQCCLSCSTESKENGDIIVWSDVCRCMKRQGALYWWKVTLWHQRHHVIHDCEDTFLHLAGVLCAQDHHLLPLERDRDRCRRGHAGGLTVAREHACIEDDERPLFAALLKLNQFFWSWWHQHVLHEERMVGTRSDHSNRDAVLLLPATKTINDVQLLLQVQVIHGTLTVCHEGLDVKLHVYLAPPDIVIGSLLDDNTFIKRRPSCLLATLDSQRSGGDNGTPRLIFQSLLIEDSGG
mmetsp:Transcript_13491/g.24393  ORF Transcript_13491/g.24393 Transcript_13491/m.24393 type:complete len:249 (+) Transcript_13491:318-1064(+)